MFLVIVVSNNIVCQPASLPPKEDGLETADPKTPPPLPAAPRQITRRVACRMTPLQLQLYADVLAKDWAKVNAMGEC